MLISQSELETLLLNEFGVSPNEIQHFTPLDISVFVKPWEDVNTSHEEDFVD